ncbi:unnamed protein product [Rodentolepis nana]|uniref:Secreted protein n=1 Tax=Rodentolepis nana TaxID=102285 RepID=A0A0R3TH53_RODNA|nr:unnamed protein product [Rodentolepis nana]
MPVTVCTNWLLHLMPVTVCTNSAMSLHARDCLYQFGYVIDEDIEKSAGCDSFLWKLPCERPVCKGLDFDRAFLACL